MIPMSQIDTELSIYKKNQVVLFGLGYLGKKLLDIFSCVEIKPTYICDNDPEKWGKHYGDIPVISPTELHTLYGEQENIFIQIAVNTRNSKEVEKQLCDLGIKNIIPYEECFQMLSYYIKCDTLQQYPTLFSDASLVLEEYTEHGGDLFNSYPNRHGVRTSHDEVHYLLHELHYFLAHKHQTGIFICMPGKTADLTLQKTFQVHGVPCHMTGHYSGFFSNQALKGEKVKIITAVRDPIGRDVSSLYYQLKFLGTRFFEEAVYQNKTNDAQVIFDCFFQNFRESCYSSWFSRFKDDVVDLQQYPFDKEAGYTIIQEGNYDIFVYQLEKLNDIVPQLSDWVGVPFDTLENTNITSDTWLAKSYQQGLKEMKFTKKYADLCYNDPYLQHFYSASDIERFKNKWKNNIES